MTTASELFPLKLPRDTSTYPPSPKHETPKQTHRCLNPACCPVGGRKNFLLQDLGWVPGTSPPPHQLADVYDSVRGLIANCQVVMARRTVESCLWAGACWQKEEEEDWLSQGKDYRLECFRHKWGLFQDEDHVRKDLTMFLERAWSLTLVAWSWLVHVSVHCKLTRGERPEPMWIYQIFHFCPHQRAEGCSSPRHREPDKKKHELNGKTSEFYKTLYSE